MKKLLLITIFLMVSCGEKYRSSWDYQAGFCRKVPECLVDRKERDFNPAIHVWISDTEVFIESEFYISEYEATLWIDDEKCRRNLTAIYERDIIPYNVECRRNKDVHHSHHGHVRVIIGEQHTHPCHYKPTLSTEDISIYRCKMEITS